MCHVHTMLYMYTCALRVMDFRSDINFILSNSFLPNLIRPQSALLALRLAVFIYLVTFKSVNCFQVKGTRIIAMHAVFGLCRKRSSDVSVRPPLFTDVFCEDQESVDQFVSGYDSASHVID